MIVITILKNSEVESGDQRLHELEGAKINANSVEILFNEIIAEQFPNVERYSNMQTPKYMQKKYYNQAAKNAKQTIIQSCKGKKPIHL